MGQVGAGSATSPGSCAGLPAFGLGASMAGFSLSLPCWVTPDVSDMLSLSVRLQGQKWSAEQVGQQAPVDDFGLVDVEAVALGRGASREPHRRAQSTSSIAPHDRHTT